MTDYLIFRFHAAGCRIVRTVDGTEEPLAEVDVIDLLRLGLEPAKLFAIMAAGISAWFPLIPERVKTPVPREFYDAFEEKEQS